MEIKLRPYQQECIDGIPESGSFMIQMATGLGKTVTFSRIPRKGRMLILSHREELVRQPLKYFDCMTGVEMAGETAMPLTEVVSASVQSLIRRLNRYDPEAFDTIIIDEAHHSASKTYREILNHFTPRLKLGFTATPNRGDRVRLDDIFEDIIFSRDLRWGIENKYLSDIDCRRVSIGYDLSNVHTRLGDYAPGELDQAMDGTADAIAQAYRDLAFGSTLIFAVSVRHAQDIAAKIPGAIVVTGETKNRHLIVDSFTRGEIKCIVNCMVFTEGTDIPRVETIIAARPTQSDSLYTQMVGRGLRMFPGKDKLRLIDCVGVTAQASLRTAPTLLGIDLANVPEDKACELEGDLFDLPELVMLASDCPQSWIRNVKIIDLWAKEQKYITHNVAWFKMPDGSLILQIPDHDPLIISCPDNLGRVQYFDTTMPMQKALDLAYQHLRNDCADSKALWDQDVIDRWGKAPASEKQLSLIRRRLKNFNADDLTKGQASLILNRLMADKSKKRRRSA